MATNIPSQRRKLTLITNGKILSLNRIEKSGKAEMLAYQYSFYNSIGRKVIHDRLLERFRVMEGIRNIYTVVHCDYLVEV